MTTVQMLTGIKNWVLGKVADINALIPSQASTSNQLADKAFVNSSIATSTATFRGTFNLVIDLGLTTDAMQQQIAAALATMMAALSIDPSTNDYCFVQVPAADATPTVIARVDRYKFNGSAWAFEYTLNNSGFTAEQWAAINSGVTSGDMTKLRALPTSVELTTLLNGKVSLVDNGAYDVSANNGGITFVSLSALLSSEDLDTLIPSVKRKGGMSIKFVLSSDNKYVQCRLMADEFSTDVEDWEQAASAAKLEELEDNAVMTGSYDATVAVGLADNLRGDDIVSAEFYYRKTGGSHNVGSGIAAIKEIRGKSIVWNQVVANLQVTSEVLGITRERRGNALHYSGTCTTTANFTGALLVIAPINTHKYYLSAKGIPNTCRISAGNVLGQDSYVGAFVGPNFGVLIPEGVTIDADVYFACVDLTLMFGAGNEPATAEEFEKMFPLDYYNYNAGEVIPFAGQSLVTTWFNLYNGGLEAGNIDSNGNPSGSNKGYIRTDSFTPVFPNTNYFIKFFNIPIRNDYQVYAIWYDANKNFISRLRINDYYGDNPFSTTTSPQNARYVKTFVYSSTPFTEKEINDTKLCINISNTDKNGTYEPYEKHTLPLNPSQWRDEQGNLVFPFGGMHGVGTAYDYAKVDADGYIRKVVRCFGGVDLGTLSWQYVSGDNSRMIAIVSGIKMVTNYETKGNVICSIYEVSTSNNIYIHAKDKTIAVHAVGSYIWVYDTDYSDAATFKAAMNGVMLYYELETPVEVELATPVYAKYLVDKDGTEEVSPANGAEPYTTPANLSILYAMDARGTITNLPKNYLSKESAENMLNAMVAAGVIQSYTMTYDAANARYQFTFVKAQEAQTNQVNNESNI